MQGLRPANPTGNIRLILLGLWLLILLVLLIQNWGPPVRLVVGGQSGSPIPLSLVLLTAYGAGMGLGLLYVGSWRLHDWRLQRQAIRKLMQLSDRVSFLESQMIPPSHYLPQDLPEPEYTPDPNAGRYSYSNIPPERVWDPAQTRRTELLEPDERMARPPYSDEEEEEWES